MFETDKHKEKKKILKSWKNFYPLQTTYVSISRYLLSASVCVDGFGGVGDWTQGLVHAKQALYDWSSLKPQITFYV
jgi:hypothetical protein